jgi:UDP-N-acetylmuramoyl-L-alanyl-D-glutamate--2,6-diaminopimelate ligase
VSTLGGHPLASARPSTVPGCSLADVAAALGLPSPVRDVQLTGAGLDSRQVRPGDLYAALPGSRAHGARFAQQAVAAGAAAVLTDPAGADLAAGCAAPVLVVPDPRAVLGEVSALVYGRPAQRLLMLGVTGTNGKTTVTYLIDSALRARGVRTGLVGTVETRVGEEHRPSVRTTPEAPDVQGLLALMVEREVRVCSMEVSSHALCLHRVDGIVFDVVAFTNLSRDHLDFHPTMTDYFGAKAMLFGPDRARQGVVCVDDEWGRRLAAEAVIPVLTLATRTPEPGTAEPDWRVVDRTVAPGGMGTDFVLESRDGTRVRARSPLAGDFNVANTALALLVLTCAGHDPHRVAADLATVAAVPGRMERVPGPGVRGEPLALVDYAHTPAAVGAAVTALADAPRPLVVVLGAGGDRDRDKRPLMGEAAARGADVVVVTDDNPRSEDPALIRAAVLAGARSVPAVPGGGPVVVEVPDRGAAVAEAVAMAWGRGTVLVAGKGHEQGQEVAGVVEGFDDRAVLAAALRAEADRRAGARTGGGTPVPGGVELEG